MDETYVKVAGPWVYLYRAVGQFGQVINVYGSTRRAGTAVREPLSASREGSSGRWWMAILRASFAVDFDHGDVGFGDRFTLTGCRVVEG